MKKLIFVVLATLLLTTSTALAEKGYLYLSSTPDSAVVTIDGFKSESYFTPFLCTLSVGIHDITISKEYHPTKTFKVTIQPEYVTKQSVVFTGGAKIKSRSSESIFVPGKRGQLTFITNPLGAEIFESGKRVGSVTPYTLSDIPAGKHTYSIVYHYLKYDTTIEITGDAPQTAMVDFNEFSGDKLYSIMPHVSTKVVIVVPGCKYTQDETTGDVLIKGVDAEIRIRTGDTSLTLTHRELANFPATETAALAKKRNETRLPQTEYTYIFEPYIDAKLRFDIRTFTNNNKPIAKDSARVQSYYHYLPASLNSGEDVNIRIYIEEDGDILFRYW